MDISDIQKKKDDITEKVEIAFCDSETLDDIIKITLTKDAIWQIVSYAHSELSYATELSKKLNQ